MGEMGLNLLHQIKKKLIIGMALGAAVMIGLALYADFGRLCQELKKFRWPLLPAILFLAFGNYVFRFFKWEYYLRLLGIKIRKKESAAIFFGGLSMSVTPGKFGEVLKSFLLKGVNGTPISYSAPIVVAERFTDFIAILLLSTLGMFSFQHGTQVFLLSVGIIAASLAILGYRPLGMKVIGFLETIPFVAKFAHKFHTAYNSMARLVTLKPLLVMTVLSVFSWLCECVGFYLVFWGFGIRLSLVASTFIYAFTTLIGALSMLPGGLGATEGTMILGLQKLFNLEKDQASAATLLIRACTLWFAVAVGIAVLLLFHRILGKGAEEALKEA